MGCFVGGLFRKGEVWGTANPPVYGVDVRSVVFCTVFSPQNCSILGEEHIGSSFVSEMKQYGRCCQGCAGKGETDGEGDWHWQGVTAWCAGAAPAIHHTRRCHSLGRAQSLPKGRECSCGSTDRAPSTVLAHALGPGQGLLVVYQHPTPSSC